MLASSGNCRAGFFALKEKVIELDPQTVIPSINNLAAMDQALAAPSPYVLLTCVHAGNLKELAEKVIAAKKLPLVHVDLIGGFKPDREGIRLLRNLYHVAGVFTQSAQVVAAAKKISMLAIQRVFMLDSRYFQTGLRATLQGKPDGIEFLPGPVATKYWGLISHLAKDMTLIAGGMIRSREEAAELFQLGFSAITTSSTLLWKGITSE